MGAGSAGCGIASLIRKVMTEAGLPDSEAARRFFMVDRDGLLVEGMEDIATFQQPFLQAKSSIDNWTLDHPDRIALLNANVLVNLAMKNFVQPGLMVLGTVLFGVTGALAHQAIITGAVPTATAAAMFALKSKTYTTDATATILISTVLGVITEGMLIAFFF